MSLDNTVKKPSREEIISLAKEAEEFLGFERGPDSPIEDASDEELIEGSIDRANRLRAQKQRRIDIENTLRGQIAATQSGIERALAIEYLEPYGMTYGNKKPPEFTDDELRSWVVTMLQKLI
jgi:hypothetical protein